MTSSYVLSILTAIVSSGVIWSVLQWWMQRQLRKTQHARERAELDKQKRDADQAEQDRAELLAEAQNTAQRTALDSANARYDGLKHDYDVIKDNMTGLREASMLLIDAFEGFLVRLHPTGQGTEYQVVVQFDEVQIARNTIKEARRRLFS